MALTKQEIESWKDKLEFEKEKVPSRKKFPSDVNQELDALEKELAGYGLDPEFSAEILRQLAESIVRNDGNDRRRLRWARSIIKREKSGDQMEMLLVVQMISVHGAKMNLAALTNASKAPDHIDSYGNICNKFARTYVDQMGMLLRLRSGPEQKLTVQNVSVSDGGQAIVGNVTQKTGDRHQTATTKSPPLVADQSGTVMPIIEPDDRSVTTVPRIEQDQQPAPSTTRRKRRS